jgi:26S proteasome regulatory subunit N5
MDKREKLEFILYQMRIMLKKQDYVRFFIISKKINENNINDPDIVDLKVTFYAYMAAYYNHQHDYSHATRAYRILHSTLHKATKPIPSTLEFGFSARKEDILANYVGFLVLQPFSEKNHSELKELSEQE